MSHSCQQAHVLGCTLWRTDNIQAKCWGVVTCCSDVSTMLGSGTFFQRSPAGSVLLLEDAALALVDSFALDSCFFGALSSLGIFPAAIVLSEAKSHHTDKLGIQKWKKCPSPSESITQACLECTERWSNELHKSPH